MNRLHRIILEELNKETNTIRLYRCYDDEIVTSDWIWISDSSADNQYGENVAEFDVPINNFKIADYNTALAYIKKYDIKNFQDAINDEYLSNGMEFFDWNSYKKGSISDEDAYNKIDQLAWTEVLEHPSAYTFAEKLKEDGYDGYCFDYIDFTNGQKYYAFFDAKKILPYRVR